MTHPLPPLLSLSATPNADAGSVALTRKRKRDRPADVPRSPTAKRPLQGKTTAQGKSRGAGKGKGSEPPSESEETKPREEDEEEAAERDSEPAGVDDEIAGAEPDEDEDAFAEPKDEEGERDSVAHSGPLSKPMSTGSMERLDPMAAYLREVQRHPLLTPEQTHELAAKFVADAGPRARGASSSRRTCASW